MQGCSNYELRTYYRTILALLVTKSTHFDFDTACSFYAKSVFSLIVNWINIFHLQPAAKLGSGTYIQNFELKFFTMDENGTFVISNSEQSL